MEKVKEAFAVGIATVVGVKVGTVICDKIINIVNKKEKEHE